MNRRFRFLPPLVGTRGVAVCVFFQLSEIHLFFVCLVRKSTLDASEPGILIWMDPKETDGKSAVPWDV